MKWKDLLWLGNKLIKKIPDPCHAKEHFQSFLRKKNRKSVKRSEISTYQPKTFENPNIVNIKSVITEHQHIKLHKQTSQRSPKTKKKIRF